MGDDREVLPLRIIAARFISSNELEGLETLNRVTSEMARIVRRRYRIWEAAFTALLGGTAFTILPGLWLTLHGVKGGQVVACLGLIVFGLWLATAYYWRWFQYGRIKDSLPQPAIYSNPNDPVARNLERFFQIAQLETTPRAFFVTRNNLRRYVHRRYFFGKLRAALVSEDAAARQLVFSPSGLWFSKELFMEVNVEALIEQAKAKPSRAGAPKTYDYTDAVMSLIEHPAIRSLVLGKRGQPADDRQFARFMVCLEENYCPERHAACELRQDHSGRHRKKSCGEFVVLITDKCWKSHCLQAC